MPQAVRAFTPEAIISMDVLRFTRFLVLAFAPALLAAQSVTKVQQKIADGTLEGVISGDDLVKTFKGVPYAAPPVGPLRWKPPQPVIPWSGVREASKYGPRAMQKHKWDDMIFHDAGPSEDCLYLNLWIPNQIKGPLPVMFWIHGGGFVAGASSEDRQDGGNLCKKGVIVVSLNYRMGIFGLMAHPELAAESDQHASGNYGLMDQVAALRWVQRNIATFGGDPNNVTIFGESAGSWSVSMLVASPQAQGLFRRAIGESGGSMDFGKPMWTLAQAEDKALQWAQKAVGTTKLADLRAMPAGKLLDASWDNSQDNFDFCVDGAFLPEAPLAIYRAGRQNRVDLLAGWNRDEGSAGEFFGDLAPTLANYRAVARKKFGARADDFLRAYSATTDAEARRAAADYQGDDFIAGGTWRWIELHRRLGLPVYRYQFDQPLPLAPDAKPGTEPVVPHASDIPFVFRVLWARAQPSTDVDRQVSEMMASYWTNFAKNGDPNGAGLSTWPRYDEAHHLAVMHLSPQPTVTHDDNRAHYEFLERTEAAK
ncbi:MAG TPA: carboxylesterase family protein [Candidatus Didemnitutus sp.]|nr:carboxylesterase family protein [Candidatus Didemnitutus sp.]